MPIFTKRVEWEILGKQKAIISALINYGIKTRCFYDDKLLKIQYLHHMPQSVRNDTKRIGNESTVKQRAFI